MTVPVPLAATSVSFDVVFGVFAAAMLVLIGITLRWAVRRDRARRVEWERRREGPRDPGVGAGRVPSSNGARPPRAPGGAAGRARRGGPRPGPGPSG